jgi:hypothetical protein
MDLENRLKVSPDDGRAFANSYGLEFFETSSQRNHGVEEPFSYLAHLFFEAYEQRVAAIEGR